jgi:hypothetical protein
MSTTCELPGPGKVVAGSEVKPLEEAVWQAWLKKGRAQEEWDSAARMTSVKWLAIAALLTSGVLSWSGLSTYGVVVKFIVAGGAIAVMLQAVHTRNYVIAIVFGALALLYNPVVPVFRSSGDWQRASVLTTVIPFIMSLAWRNSKIASRSILTGMIVLGATSAAAPGDLSKYRNFQLGMDLATVAGQTGERPSNAKVIATRPALIQELEWSPQPLGPATQPEAVKNVLFSFYDNQLFQIAVNYDRYQTEGLTADDIIETISAAYGTAATRPAVDKGSNPFNDEVVSQWEDTQYRLDLIRVPYGSLFSLRATVKRLESPVQAALLEAKRLDSQEAPQREAARVADEAQSERARLEKIRLVNKPKFRP